MKTPLILLTVTFLTAFFDGMFGWNLADGFYILSGMTQMVALGWMWVVLARS